jgi:thiamine transporter ThiT
VECGVLRERLGSTGHRDLVVRLIELGILGLLAFAIDFAKSGSWTGLGVSVLLSAILVIAIFMIQRGHRPAGSK